MSGVMLIGAGGHGRVVSETCHRLRLPISGYVDPEPADWLDAQRYDTEEVAFSRHPTAMFALGLAGVTPRGLTHREAVHRRCLGFGGSAPTLVHPDASCARDARIAAGAQVLALARVAADAEVGEGAIVNTGAIVEHSSRIGAFAHVAPGAIVLGDAIIGAGAMVGAGAIVLPGARVAAGAMVKAGTRVPR